MTCVACHTGHHTQMDQAQSSVFNERLSSTCNRCHEKDQQHSQDLAHGNIMSHDSTGHIANCTECHSYHFKINDDKHVRQTSLRFDCSRCHQAESAAYQKSIHGISRSKGHPEAPNCRTCHGDTKIEESAASSMVSLSFRSAVPVMPTVKSLSSAPYPSFRSRIKVVSYLVRRRSSGTPPNAQRSRYLPSFRCAT